MGDAMHIFDERKFGELVVYFAQRCADDPNFGATKLHKLLFFSDFGAFGEIGRSITGADYQKLDHGPAARQCLPMQARLERAGVLTVEERYLGGGYTQKRAIAHRAADTSAFAPEELRIIDGVIERYKGMTASEISDRAHEHPGWQLAKPSATIPYVSELIPRRPVELTQAQTARMREGVARIIAESWSR